MSRHRWTSEEARAAGVRGRAAQREKREREEFMQITRVRLALWALADDLGPVGSATMRVAFDALWLWHKLRPHMQFIPTQHVTWRAEWRVRRRRTVTSPIGAGRL